MTASAQAQVIHPNDTDVFGQAANPTLDYEGATVVCDTGTASGHTGIDVDFVNLELEFFGNCNVSGLAATVTCTDASGTDNGVGTARLQALDATTNAGTIDRLNTGFQCDVVVAGICTITVAAQELPIPGGISEGNLLDEGGADPSIDADVDVNASRTGSTLCGPATGVGGFTGIYAVDPDNISVD